MSPPLGAAGGGSDDGQVDECARLRGDCGGGRKPHAGAGHVGPGAKPRPAGKPKPVVNRSPSVAASQVEARLAKMMSDVESYDKAGGKCKSVVAVGSDGSEEGRDGESRASRIARKRLDAAREREARMALAKKSGSPLGPPSRIAIPEQAKPTFHNADRRERQAEEQLFFTTTMQRATPLAVQVAVARQHSPPKPNEAAGWEVAHGFNSPKSPKSPKLY